MKNKDLAMDQVILNHIGVNGFCRLDEVMYRTQTKLVHALDIRDVEMRHIIAKDIERTCIEVLQGLGVPFKFEGVGSYLDKAADYGDFKIYVQFYEWTDKDGYQGIQFRYGPYIWKKTTPSKSTWGDLRSFYIDSKRYFGGKMSRGERLVYEMGGVRSMKEALRVIGRQKERLRMQASKRS